MESLSSSGVEARKYGPFEAMLFWLGTSLAVFPVAFRQISVSDVWWHVACGKWLVEHRSLPDLSLFYFSPFDGSGLPGELRWSWLGDIVLYLAHGMAGSVGLQLLGLALLGFCLFSLSRIPPAPRSAWLIFLFGVLVVATYQLQIVRNSAYSLAFYPLVLWLGLRKSSPPSLREYVGVILMLFLWSCFHGSCTLGWVTASILFFARSLAGVRNAPGSSCLRVGVCIGAMILSLFLISVGRPDASGFISLPARHLAFPLLSHDSARKPPSAHGSPDGNPETGNVENGKTKNSVPTLVSLKNWLNSSVWKRDPQAIWSNDFWSPFDFPPTPLIGAPFLLIVAALLCLLLFRNVGWGLILAWCMAVFLGLGYVRMLGYASIASASVLISSLGGMRFPSAWTKVSRVGGWLAAVALLCFFWGNLLTGWLPRWLGEGQHVSAWGHTPLMDEHLLDWVKHRLPEANVFTTIDSGSAALLEWNFEKPVFIDGFFAPHRREVFADYSQSLRSGSPAVLEQKYGVTAAIIPNKSNPWLETFLFSPDWYPAALGIGNTVFLNKNAFPPSQIEPAILYSVSDVEKTSFLFSYHASVIAFATVAHARDNEHGHSLQEWNAVAPSFFKDLSVLAEKLAAENRPADQPR